MTPLKEWMDELATRLRGGLGLRNAGEPFRAWLPRSSPLGSHEGRAIVKRRSTALPVGGMIRY
jgi:hypothetical protein